MHKASSEQGELADLFEEVWHLAETAASAHDVETMGLHRFTFGRADVPGLLLGFAAFDEDRIREGLAKLAGALEGRRHKAKHGRQTLQRNCG